ncbi:MAG: hypothetical protein IJ539_05355 [Prevotella sp.]|nr:hypothetical protein [Prevotella sp.]
MINLALKGIEKGSSVMEIEAAVLRVMEKVNFQPKEIDTELTDAKSEGCLVMVFVAKELTGEELINLQSEFGKKFTLKVLGKSKSDIFLQVEAPKDDFLNLGKRYVYQEPRPMHTPSSGAPGTDIPSRTMFDKK